MRITRSVILIAALVSAMSACAGASDPEEAARKRCVTLRDHLIDLRLETAAPSVNVSAHRVAMQQALGDRFVDDCRELPEAQVRCELAAKDSEGATACAPSSSP